MCSRFLTRTRGWSRDLREWSRRLAGWRIFKKAIFDPPCPGPFPNERGNLYTNAHRHRTETGAIAFSRGSTSVAKSLIPFSASAISSKRESGISSLYARP